MTIHLKARLSVPKMNCRLDRSVAEWRDLQFLLFPVTQTLKPKQEEVGDLRLSRLSDDQIFVDLNA
jgi:hypothetical protein